MRRPGAFLVIGLMLTACSGGSHRSTPPTSVTRTLPPEVKVTPEVIEFCNRASDLTNATAQVGVATSLSAVRAAMKDAVGAAGDAVDYPAPSGSGMHPVLQAIDSDLATVNSWLQTQATQADLDHNVQPHPVAVKFQDLGPKFRALEAWTGRDCPRTSGGDNH